MTVDVRPIQERDLPAAARLYVEVFNAAPWNDQWTFPTALARLQDTLNTPGAFGLIADGDNPPGALIGYVEQWYDGRHFYLKELFVAPERQRTGIGTSLMHRLEVTLREQGVNRIYLLTEASGPAADFYSKRGYYRSPKTALMAHRLS
jgi:aminoglycoside 6'-N-acetyltransferase I